MEEKGKLGFIGAGNMASALTGGLLDSGLYKREQIFASDKSQDALLKIRDLFRIGTLTNKELVERCETVVIAVKPQNLEEMLTHLRQAFSSEHLVISIAAGIPIDRILDILAREIPVIRVMPNTPALIRKGASALAGSPLVTPGLMDRAESIFSSVGETFRVDEGLIDAVTAVSGSGPGYVFRIMECMVKAAVELGLPQEKALPMVIQTFIGAAGLARESDQSLEQLRKMVTSPGGTTAAGLERLDSMGLEDMILQALKAARNRSIELGKGK